LNDFVVAHCREPTDDRDSVLWQGDFEISADLPSKEVIDLSMTRYGG